MDDSGTASLPQVTLTYGYDDAGNRASLDDSLGGLTSYSYDVRDELTSLTQSGSGVTAKRVDFAYDAAGRMTTLTRFSDLAGSTQVIVSKFAYDAANRLTTLTHQTSGGTVRSQYGYTLDAANRLTGESRAWTTGGGSASDTLSYSYTNDDQLTGVTHTNGSFTNESYSYDTNGNRTMTGYATATGNRMSSDGVYNYTYDDDGNRTVKTSIATGDQTLYTYDYRNRLVEVDNHPSGGATTVLATYVYDALDRRIKVVEGGTTTATLYDGASAILDFNGSGTQKARYLQGPAIDMVLAREVSGTVAWYLTDRLGTVRDIADNTGAIIDHVDYDSYGKILAESSPANGDRWKFTGREWDAVTELQYNRARYYDPAVGRAGGTGSGFGTRVRGLHRGQSCASAPINSLGLPSRVRMRTRGTQRFDFRANGNQRPWKSEQIWFWRFGEGPPSEPVLGIWRDLVSGSSCCCFLLSTRSARTGPSLTPPARLWSSPRHPR